MEMQICPKCAENVLPRDDGQCPRCGAAIGPIDLPTGVQPGRAKQANPYESPQMTGGGSPFAFDGAEAPGDRVAALERRIFDLERRVAYTRLVSHNFLARAFAVFGHWFVAYLIVGLGFMVVYIVIAIVFVLIFAGIAAR